MSKHTQQIGINLFRKIENTMLIVDESFGAGRDCTTEEIAVAMSVTIATAKRYLSWLKNEDQIVWHDGSWVPTRHLRAREVYLRSQEV